MSRHVVKAAVGLLSIVAFGAIAAGCTGVAVPGHVTETPTVALLPPKVRDSLQSSLRGVGEHRPNIVFILTDDLSTNLIQYMPHVQAMQRHGMTFTNYTVADSLCCPSRASIFTGRYPHNTQVWDNVGPYGGFAQFHRRGEEKATFATALQSAGYRTAMMGKYLNGYVPITVFSKDVAGKGTPAPSAGPNNYVPPGWNTWNVAGAGYGEFHYYLNQNHRIVYYGARPSDYGVDVLSRLGRDFVHSSVQAKTPFALEIATFAPHDPYVPAPEDSQKFPGLTAPRDPSFNQVPRNAPPWLIRHHKLRQGDIDVLDRDFRLRAQSVQSVDRMIGNLQDELRRSGQLRNTVFVFSSDNGLHLGNYTLRAGKLTAFDIDVNVPLIVTGPAIPAGEVNDEMVQNTDLAPTFEAIAGITPPANIDGHDLSPLLLGRSVAWRSAALIEHLGPDMFAADPDYQAFPAGNPPSYDALRTQTYTYVRYLNGDHEFYDRVHDPYQMDNIYRSLSRERVAKLDAQLRAIMTCHTTATCWDASLPSA